MKLFPDGDRVFEVISRYDHLLTLEGKEDHEPGDTCAFIVPFLLLHNISEDDITSLAVNATLTGGAADLVPWLLSKTWKVFCITTAYEQYAMHITHKLGIFAHNLASTKFPLNEFRQSLSDKEMAMVKQVEADILTMLPVADDARIKQSLDEFFQHKLPASNPGSMIKEVKPVGGSRKVGALKKFADTYSQPVSKWVVVGDNVADSRLLQTVNGAGGLAIVFNSDEYALPHATVGLASASINDLREVLEAWQKGQRSAVEKLVKQKEKAGGAGDRANFHWLAGRKDLDEIVKIPDFYHLVSQRF